jgi:hypothetical protein
MLNTIYVEVAISSTRAMTDRQPDRRMDIDRTQCRPLCGCSVMRSAQKCNGAVIFIGKYKLGLAGIIALYGALRYGVGRKITLTEW